MKKYTLITDMVALIRLQKAGYGISRRDCLMMASMGGKIFTKDEFREKLAKTLEAHGYKPKKERWTGYAFYWWKNQGAIFAIDA